MQPAAAGSDLVGSVTAGLRDDHFADSVAAAF